MKWGEAYARKSDAFASTPQWQKEASLIIQNLPSCGAVLEVACNTGRFLQMASRARPDLEFSGMDINTHGIDLAKKRMPETTFHTSLWRFAPESFDSVVIMHALPQIEHPEDTLVRVWDVLRPGGTLIMLHHNALNDYLWVVPNLFTGYRHDETITDNYSKNDTVRIAKDCGFVKLMSTHLGGENWLRIASILSPDLQGNW